MDQLFEYAKSLGDNAEILLWLNTAARKAVASQKTNESELEHVIDWLYSDAAPKRLQKLSIADAKRLTHQWTEKNKSKGKDLTDGAGDIEDLLLFEDESKIVKLLSENAFKREGYLMSHCLGGYSLRSGYDIYSLRDKSNQPHATFEVSTDNKDILQIKGKGNGPIHPKYIHRVLAFLEKLGMHIRPSEMVSLGYYHVPEIHLNFVKQKLKKDETLIELGGEFYVT